VQSSDLQPLGRWRALAFNHLGDLTNANLTDQHDQSKATAHLLNSFTMPDHEMHPLVWSVAWAHISSTCNHSVAYVTCTSDVMNLNTIHNHSPTHSLTHTHRHTDTQTHRHTDTQTHRHTDTETETDAQTHRHRLTLSHTHTFTSRLHHCKMSKGQLVFRFASHTFRNCTRLLVEGKHIVYRSVCNMHCFCYCCCC
jgi:hypothetical protein